MPPDDAQEALTATAVNKAQLDGHERICAERYADIKDSFGRVHKRLDAIMYGLIALLLTMVGWLIVNGVPWPK
jgi:predicted nucleic acid-binding Zn ribbon protein